MYRKFRKSEGGKELPFIAHWRLHEIVRTSQTNSPASCGSRWFYVISQCLLLKSRGILWIKIWAAMCLLPSLVNLPTLSFNIEFHGFKQMVRAFELLAFIVWAHPFLSCIFLSLFRRQCMAISVIDLSLFLPVFARVLQGDVRLAGVHVKEKWMLNCQSKAACVNSTMQDSNLCTVQGI